MKNIYKYMACALVLSGALSCSKLNETPVFEDSKSFVAMNSTSYIVNEDCGKLVIPVTMASPTTKQAAVAYTVTDGTAKLGTNYSLVDEAAVLVFDGETYTQNIEINIVNFATTAEQSGYTGDLTFTVTLASAGDLELGFNKTCTVKIMDLDHPLASILGTYDVTGTFYGGNAASWVMTMAKDETDPTVVWIDTPSYFAVAAASWGEYHVYGNVSEDLKTITIPCGQPCAPNSASPAWCDDESDTFLFGAWAPGIELIDSGVVTFTQQADGTWTTEDAPAVWPKVSYTLYTQMLMDAGSMTLKKQ